MPIYLIGYMAAGKTTVGQLLAKKTGWHFVDLDAAFQEVHGLSAADYIRAYSIDDFHRKEKYVLEDIADISPYENVVYATGGGYPCYKDNMECLKELGTSIYIRWQAKDLAARLMLTNLDERPVLQGRNQDELETFITLQLEAREPFYLQADHTINAPGFIPEADEIIAQEIIKLLNL